MKSKGWTFQRQLSSTGHRQTIIKPRTAQPHRNKYAKYGRSLSWFGNFLCPLLPLTLSLSLCLSHSPPYVSLTFCTIEPFKLDRFISFILSHAHPLPHAFSSTHHNTLPHTHTHTPIGQRSVVSLWWWQNFVQASGKHQIYGCPYTLSPLYIVSYT